MKSKAVKIFLLALICSFMADTSACINVYRTLLNGEVVYRSTGGGVVGVSEIIPQAMERKSQKLYEKFLETDSLHYLSDYAAALIYLGKYEEAKRSYQKIERELPNQYTTASNLGTLYELMGQPDSALIWINKSIAINPRSHAGSEWIHIKILEFKLASDQDIKASILGLDFGNKAVPANPKNYELDELKRHIWYQLGERLPFVGDTNQIVGNIYFDLGNLIAQTEDVQAALESFHEAEKYGYDSELLQLRIEALEKLAKKAIPSERAQRIKDFIREYFEIIFIFLIGAPVVVVLIFRLKSSRKTKA